MTILRSKIPPRLIPPKWGTATCCRCCCKFKPGVSLGRPRGCPIPRSAKTRWVRRGRVGFARGNDVGGWWQRGVCWTSVCADPSSLRSRVSRAWVVGLTRESCHSQVRLIWPSRLSIPKALYFMNRYSEILNVLILVYSTCLYESVLS